MPRDLGFAQALPHRWEGESSTVVSQGSETESSVSMGPRSLQALDEFLTQFQVYPVVVVRSKFLKIPQIMIIVFVSVALVLYFVYDLRALAPLTVKVAPVLDVVEPFSNWWHCQEGVEGTGNCNSVWHSATQPGYCNISDPEIIFSCNKFRLLDLVPPGQVPNTELSIGLSQIPACSYAGEAEQACLKTGHPVFAEDVEDLNLRIRTTMHTLADRGFMGGFFGAKDYDAADVQSLLKFRNGSVMRLQAAGRTLDEKVDYLGQQHFINRYPMLCGGISGSLGSCMSTAWGDLISLKIVLEAAGVELDNSVRVRGLILDVSIVFTNLDPDDYWAWPIGEKPKIVYEVRRRTTNYNRTQAFMQSIANFTELRTIVNVVPSIRLISFSEATMGKLSIFRFATELAIMSTVLGLSTAAVQHILTAIYRRFSNMKHIYYLHEFATKKETDNCTTYQHETPDKIEERLHQLRSRRVGTGLDEQEVAEEVALARLLV